MHPLVVPIRQMLEVEFGQQPITCAFATADYNGTPSVRTMVLREITDDGAFVFGSDRRTHKDDHLRDRPQCEILFWLPGRNVQIRVVASAGVLDAMNDIGLREALWDRLDARGTRILSHEKGVEALETPMPVTFEIIKATPTAIRIEDYTQKPISVETWSA